MNRSFYGERDYAFGQAMLTLRITIGETQVGLAERLGITRKSINRWEAGDAYPKVPHLKALLAFALEQKAFSAGREEEQIRAFWHAAHQKMLIDESWLQELLRPRHRLLTLVPDEPIEQIDNIEQNKSWPAQESRVDWGDALAVTTFYGRERELNLLTSWIVQDRCRVVSVLGLGGIGKSTLAVRLMHQIAEHFEVVIWRSLRDVPSCEALLDECLQVLAPQELHNVAASLESRQDLLLECLRNRRVLLVCDNLESFLEEGEGTGHMRVHYEGFARVLYRVAQTEHQSCLLITSREKPSELVPLEGNHTPVRALRLANLDIAACQQLLAEKGIIGSLLEQTQLIEVYAGNPLALKIVAQTVVELFGCKVAPFLKQGEMVFGSVRELLDEQFARLSAVEQSVLLWLAILRQPVSLEELLSVLGLPLPYMTVLEAMEALHRRSLIEQGQDPGSFTLQSVILEYTTARLIAEMSREIRQSQLLRLIEHSLTLAGSTEYVRQAQMRLIVAPLLLHLSNAYPESGDLENHLLGLLKRLRARADYAQGYGPANILALLQAYRGHLRSLDLSHLSLRGMHLQEAEMQDTTLLGASLKDCLWTSTFGAIWAVAISHDGQYWATGGRGGEVWVWAHQTLHLAWRAHSDVVRALSFSPDGPFLASGSYDGMVKLWDLERGTLLWSGSHTSNISGLAYSPDGSLLASGGTDATIRIWDARTGTLLETLPHPDAVFTLTWSRDGHLLASSGLDGRIRLWQIRKNEPTVCVATLSGHTNWGMGLAFSPNGSVLASANWDHTIKLWEVAGGSMLQTLSIHTERAQTVAWSPDGRTLASAAFDNTIWLWDVERNAYRAALHGHTDVVFSLAFTPNSRRLLSGSTDGTLRLWDTESGACEQILQGYAVLLYDIAWSPDGTRLASSGSDRLVSIWDVEGLAPPELLHGHDYLAFGVGWSPDGRWLASSGWDNLIQIWDATTGEGRQAMRDPDDPYTCFYGIAWSPDGQRLACGNNRREVQVWEVSTGTRQWIAREQPASARRVAWSPDGARLASAGDDGIVSILSASDGMLLTQLSRHLGKVNDVAWSYDGKQLASGGGSQGQEELLVWDIDHRECTRVLSGQPGIVYAVAWSPDSALLISGGSNGTLHWWDMQNGACVRVRRAHEGTIQRLQVSPDGNRLASCGDDGTINVWNLKSGDLLRTLRRDRPYERLNISGVKGLTEAQKASLRMLGAFEE